MAAGGELALIRSIRALAGRPGREAVRVGIGDDCAVLRIPRGHEILVTTDFTLEGRHFRRDWHPPASVGHRCLLRGLSDIAAMGGHPRAAFLSLALPAGFTAGKAGRRWVDGFFAGMLALAKVAGTPLAGGDTASAPDSSVLADIVVVGSAPAGTAILRSGARPGDALYVTGSLGGAAAELQALSERPRSFRNAGAAGGAHPHLFPESRLALADWLRRNASAAMDLSDGLSSDLRRLCDESGTGATVDAEALPIPSARGSLVMAAAREFALHGGEDYELLFTTRPGKRLPRAVRGVPVTRIGRITRGTKVLLEADGRLAPLKPAGWEHAL